MSSSDAPGAAATPCRLEVRGVGRDVGLRREATAVLASRLAGAEELDGVGDDLDRLALAAVLGLPLAPSSRPSIATGRPLER